MKTRTVLELQPKAMARQLVRFCQLDTNWSHLEERTSTGELPQAGWLVSKAVGAIS